MRLIDVVNRDPAPAPWSEGDNIPWSDPGFSERMLHEHLSQEHDLASRRLDLIHRHVEWLHSALLAEKPGRVLDLCCGPGLYTERLAARGHDCVGVDHSPAAIRYAREVAAKSGSGCRYVESDVRRTEFGTDYDLVLLIYGEFNVFRRDEAWALLREILQALTPGGRLVLEVHPYAFLRGLASQRAWHTAQDGLFALHPHLVLEEGHWDEDAQAATRRYYVVDATNAHVTRHAASYQAYGDGEYEALLKAAGFVHVRQFDWLAPVQHGEPSELLLLTAERPPGEPE